MTTFDPSMCLRISIAMYCMLLFTHSCRVPVQEESILTINEIPVPCTEGGMPFLTTSADGTVFLSWIEFLNDSTNALLFAVFEDAGWTAPLTVAAGDNWFVNWADFPSIAVYLEERRFMAAHWLEMRGEGTYDYDIRMTQSRDGGEHWQSSFVPHRDGVPAEHGFVSLVPLPEYRMFAAWLDGRHMAEASHGHGDHAHGHGGPMTLRAAVFDTTGTVRDEWELDDRVCECCQTGAVRTRKGIAVVYRDRDNSEVRDISIVRMAGDRWTIPKTIWPDGWKIAGCPVNGPAIAAAGDTVAVAWYTAPDGDARVQVIFSTDGGETFGRPMRIDNGNPLGRVALVMLPGNEAFVVWMEHDDTGARIMGARVGLQGMFGAHQTLAQAAATRQSGFPSLAVSGDRIILAWTEAGSTSIVRSAVIGM